MLDILPIPRDLLSTFGRCLLVEIGRLVDRQSRCYPIPIRSIYILSSAPTSGALLPLSSVTMAYM